MGRSMLRPYRSEKIRLLIFDGVADFGGGGAGEGGGGGVVVDFGDGGGADFVGDGLDDFAGGWVFHDADGAADVEDVADFYASLLADVDDEGVAVDVGDEAADLEFDGRNFSGRGVELGTHVIDGFVGGFAEDGVAEVAAAHVHGTTTAATVSAASADERCATAGGLAGAGDRGDDFAGVDVDHAGRDGDDRFRIFGADATETELGAVAAGAEIGVLIVAAELGDGADDDGVNAEELADFGGGGRIGAVTVGEVLLGEELVERGAFDDGILAVFDELFDEHRGDALADVLVGAEDGGDGRLDGAVVEVHDGDAMFRGRCGGRRGSLGLRGGMECERECGERDNAGNDAENTIGAEKTIRHERAPVATGREIFIGLRPMRGPKVVHLDAAGILKKQG